MAIPGAEKLEGRTGQVLVTSGGKFLILPSNPARVCLLLSKFEAATVYQVSLTLNGREPFMAHLPDQGFLEFTWSGHGLLPQAEVNLEGGMGGERIYWYELVVR